MSAQFLTTLALLSNMGGFLLLFLYGFPQPSHEEGLAIELEDATPLPNGQTVAEHNAEVRARKRRYLIRSNLGLILNFVGFGLQLWAAWLP